MMNDCPAISIIINTNGRVHSLEITLRSLLYLRYSNFEVCVVYGPTPDGTAELLEKWSDRIKSAACPEKNLSQSRNMGIALAAGDIVAFIDDDAIPEPEWLNDIAAAYAKSDVGASGGFVYNHTGTEFQWRYGTVDRLARPDLSWTRPTPEFSFPFSQNVPHLLGTNSSMRREAAISIGGFDEEFDYFLDETDVLCRLNDAGWKIEQLDGAFVHHRYQASHVRTEARVIKAWYSIIKNKIYFSVLNARGHHSFQQAIEEVLVYIDGHRKSLEWAISAGLLGEHDRVRFHEEVERAWQDGLRRALSGQRRFMTHETLSRYAKPFLKFDVIIPAEQRHTFCFLTQNYPPEPLGGVARYVHQLARTIAAAGHHVHVLTRTHHGDTVDFEDCVWVHRTKPRFHPLPDLPGGLQVPEHIWNYSATMLDEAVKISSRRDISAVYAPIWDCEGIAFVLDGRLKTATGLQTTLKFFLDSKAHLKSDCHFMKQFGEPMLEVEKLVLQKSDGIHALGVEIVREIEHAYGLTLNPDRLAHVALGLEDWSALQYAPAPSLPESALRVLFVGRLEERKGIDILLKALALLLPKHPQVHVDIVGNDTQTNTAGVTYRQEFISDSRNSAFKDRIVFHGEVPEDVLRGFYHACDIFVAPSRFESFGLILVEAMIYRKPVIGCRAGGMKEVVEDGVTGLLAEPGDLPSLLNCLVRLINDADLRLRLGTAGRRRYEQQFTPAHMAKGVLDFLLNMAGSIGERASAVAPAIIPAPARETQST